MRSPFSFNYLLGLFLLGGAVLPHSTQALEPDFTILRGEPPAIVMRLGSTMAHRVVDVMVLRGHRNPTLSSQNIYATRVRMKADSNGNIDFAKHAPLDGWSYKDAAGQAQSLHEADVWGPLWNMTTTHKDSLPVFLHDSLAEMVEVDSLTFGDIVYIAVQNGHIVNKTRLSYLESHPDVVTEIVDTEKLPEDERFKGSVTYPKICLEIPCPAKVIWGGSGGPVAQELISYWANRGIVVVSLEYFTQEKEKARSHLTYFIRQTPLEIFRNGIRYAKRLPFVDPNRVLIEGGSRGGEAALLVGVHFKSEVAGVISKRPIQYTQGSGLTGNQIQSEIARPETSSWTLNGVELPYIPLGNDGLNAWTLKQPDGVTTDAATGFLRFTFRSSFVAAFAEVARTQPDVLEKSLIPVTQISAPLAVLNPDSDGMWPSQQAYEWIRQQRMGTSNDLFFNAPGLGHVDLIPGSPTMESMDALIMGSFLDERDSEGKRIMKPSYWYCGGDPLANHRGGIAIYEANKTFTRQVTRATLKPLSLETPKKSLFCRLLLGLRELWHVRKSP